MKYLTILLFLILPIKIWAHLGGIIGKIYEKSSNSILVGATVKLLGNNKIEITNELGQYRFNNLAAGEYKLEVSNIGYKTIVINAKINNDETAIFNLAMEQAQVQLAEIIIFAPKSTQKQLIGKIDTKLRPINSSQEFLRTIPGLVIGQHAGGGKAEQIFLRGFDLDHGTDIQITTDGMPVNMVSHAHGQGYADMHFIIPELVQEINFNKGPYYSSKGNFSTAGYVELNTKNTVAKNEIKFEAGQFNSFRTLGIFNLLGEKSKTKNKSLYLAGEYNFTNGYFDNPQAFNRLNLMAKYHGHLGQNTILNTSLTTFYSKWEASGQIPERAVDSGQIGFFGAIDPNEGGETGRANLNIQLVTNTKKNTVISNQIFMTNYQFNLFSNFTFFLNDSINGDQIKQKENRNIFGYNGVITKNWQLGNKNVDSRIGLNFRNDIAHDTELSHTKNKTENLSRIKFGNINETNLGLFVDENITISDKLTANIGLRFDYFKHQYFDKIKIEKASVQNAIFSPKLTLNYVLNNNTLFYLKTGKGFHSNDTRVVVSQNGIKTLPPAYGADFGLVLKPLSNLIINPAIWYLLSDQEFIYVGDEGVVEPSGQSKRIGFDFSARYQISDKLYFDLDYNTTKPRAIGKVEGQNYLPLAPLKTSSFGLSFQKEKGLNASFRSRYVGDRPATENNSIVAKGYFISDLNLNYSKNKYSIGVFLQNIFNTKWKETQFATESRLNNEQFPVEEIHFTPGTPFFAKLSLSINF
jgi:outer membrane receptor protein involved in Fe transport